MEKMGIIAAIQSRSIKTSNYAAIFQKGNTPVRIKFTEIRHRAFQCVGIQGVGNPWPEKSLTDGAFSGDSVIPGSNRSAARPTTKAGPVRRHPP
jgi:hypothetical protein